MQLTGEGVFVPSLAAFALWDNDEHGIEDPLLLETLGSSLSTLRRKQERASAIADVAEIYLELAAVDLDDQSAIADFVADFGILGVAYERFAFFKTLPGFPQTLTQLADAWPTRRLGQSAGDYLEYRGATSQSTLVETVEEFRFGARCVRDMFRAALFVLSSELAVADPAIQGKWLSIPQEAPQAVRDEARAVGTELSVGDEAADLFLRELLSEGLRPFHPRVLYADERTSLATATVPLYAICCLELFNHLAEHAVYRRCANQRCGRLFVHQRGRAEHGQYRTRGVRYCSNPCARAQAQRDYRRRAASP
jgi:hypothetical protein